MVGILRIQCKVCWTSKIEMKVTTWNKKNFFILLLFATNLVSVILYVHLLFRVSSKLDEEKLWYLKESKYYHLLDLALEQHSDDIFTLQKSVYNVIQKLDKLKKLIKNDTQEERAAVNTKSIAPVPEQKKLKNVL